MGAIRARSREVLEDDGHLRKEGEATVVDASIMVAVAVEDTIIVIRIDSVKVATCVEEEGG